MDNLDESLQFLSHELVGCGILPFMQGDYAIFGSASLVMRGILDRMPGDIDVHFSRKLWGAMLNRPRWFVETPTAGDPPILSNITSSIPIHAFFDWSDRHVAMDVPDLIERAEQIEAFGRHYQVIPVKDALAHKKGALAYGTAYVQKHVPDIAVIEGWLEELNLEAKLKRNYATWGHSLTEVDNVL